MKFRENLSKRRHLVSGILLFLILVFSLGASGQQDVSEYKKRLADISQQIDQLKQRIQDEERKETTFLSELDRIGFNKNLINLF